MLSFLKYKIVHITFRLAELPVKQAHGATGGQSGLLLQPVRQVEPGQDRRQAALGVQPLPQEGRTSVPNLQKDVQDCKHASQAHG